MPERESQTRRRYLKGIGATSVVATAGLSGCLQGGGTETAGGGGGGGGTISGPIPMGSILPITGALSAYGEGMQKAVELAVKDINKAGGVRGAEIKLYPRDSETKPQKALQKYNSLVSNQNIVGFVGAASSGVSTTLAKNLVSDGVMEVSNASTSPVLATLGIKNGTKYFARTAPNDGQQGIVMGQIMNKDKFIGADSAAFLHVANAYGKGLAEKAKAAFNGKTLQLVPYAKKTQDYSSVLDKLHKGNPDAVGFVGYPENGQTILQQWSNGSYGTEASDWVLSEGLNSDSFLKGNKNIVSDMWLASPNPEQTAGASKFKKKIGKANTLFAAHAYDAMILQGLAMQKSGKATGTAIAKNIRSVSRGSGDKTFTVGDFKEAAKALKDGKSINYQGASSPVNLNKNLEPLNAFAIIRIQSDGTRKTVKEIPRSFFEGKL